MLMENKTVSFYLDAFLDAYHEWTVSGKGLKYASRELRYCLSAQKKRLAGKGIDSEERYEHVKDEIKGSLLKKGDPYKAQVLYRESKRLLSYRKEKRSLKEYKEPVTFYGCLLDKKDYEDKPCTCPNCGHQSLLSELSEGCPYCGTVFETEDSYPCFTSFYSVNGIVERSTLSERIKKRMIITGTATGLLLFVAFLFTYKEYAWYFRILGALFLSVLYGLVSAFIAYMINSFFLIFKMFREAGRSLPLLSGLKTKKKIEEKLKSIDPAFSFEYFEGRIISLLRTIAYSDDRDSLSIYSGKQDLSFMNDLIDIQYRGVLQLKGISFKEDMTQITVKAFLNNTYYTNRIYRKDENYLLTIERQTGSLTGLGFDILKIQCPNCGGSFDALHEKNCPHCGSYYDLVHDDWVIREIHRV